MSYLLLTRMRKLRHFTVWILTYTLFLIPDKVHDEFLKFSFYIVHVYLATPERHFSSNHLIENQFKGAYNRKSLLLYFNSGLSLIFSWI